MDTLTFAQALRDAGMEGRQAEAFAKAVNDFVSGELATRSDVTALGQALNYRIDLIEQKIERQTLALTVRMGGLLGVAVAILKLWP